MRTARIGLVALTMALVTAELATAQAPRQPPTPQPTQPTPQPRKQPMQGQRPTTTPRAPAAMDPAIMRDIETTVGFVPQFMRYVPATLLPSFWTSLKNFEMSTETRLDNKTKELIGIAVAAQIPCDYCIAFHTEHARLNGASDEEIREAIGMASVTRQGSTLLNGMQMDKTAFRKDLDRMVRQSRQQARR